MAMAKNMWKLTKAGGQILKKAPEFSTMAKDLMKDKEILAASKTYDLKTLKEAVMKKAPSFAPKARDIFEKA